MSEREYVTEWTAALKALEKALASLGHPVELGDPMARQLGSPRAIRRMTAYLYQAKPVLEKLPGWKCDITGIRTWEELPENCRNYVDEIERRIGVPITYVSNGPAREDIIKREPKL